jgi:uncharacterized protein (TIGR02145 family)
MRNLALMWVLAACLLGCGGKDKDAKDKAVSAAVAPDTVAVLPDTATIAPDTDTTFTDTRDGKVYKIVKIGSQVWFAENLNYDTAGSVCYDNKAENCAKYGRLYDWEMAEKACPAGTHLPTDKEWTTLVDYAGGEEKAGTKLKSARGWNENDSKLWSPVPGTDSYGFSALPGGYGYSGGYFINAGNYGLWWSSTEGSAGFAWYRSIYYLYEDAGRNYDGKTALFAVRCVLNAKKEQQKWEILGWCVCWRGVCWVAGVGTRTPKIRLIWRLIRRLSRLIPWRPCPTLRWLSRPIA